MPNHKILIIEDEPDFLKIYQDLLLSKGYEVITATEGNQGLKQIRDNPPDLILLDLIMPGTPGMEILETVKKEPKTQAIPVIIFSVLDQTDKIQLAMKLGARDYLIKGSAKPTEILYKIQTALGLQNDTNNISAFKVQIERQKNKSEELAKFVGIEASFTCPKCLTLLDLEMLPDQTRTEGHWFAAHLTCPACHANY